MTKEELKKEAEEKFKEWKSEQYKDQSTEEKMEFVEHLHTFPKYFEKAFNGGYLAGAEPREKQIQIDAEQIRALQKQNGELTDKVKELQEEITQLKVRACNSEAGNNGLNLHVTRLQEQIEKMKCCFNCKHSRTEYEHCKTDKHEKWEIKENDVC